MKIISLTEQQFDQFADNHRNKNFYQSSAYGTLMKKHGFNAHYIGFVDQNDEILAATLLLYKKVFKIYKYAYAPRGYLIDYNDTRLLKLFTTKLKSLLRKQNFIFLKIDPFILYRELNKQGEIIKETNYNIIQYLRSIGYIHRGFNKRFETLKPRCNATLTLDKSSEKLFFSFDKATRNNIRRAEKKGVTIHRGGREHIEMLYNLTQHKHSRKLNYYYDYYDIFSAKNMIEVYYAKINPILFLENSRNNYNKEQQRNIELTELLHNSKSQDKSNIINKKIESDNLLSLYKGNIVEATEILKKYPEGLIVAATMVIKYHKEIYFLIDGIDSKYKHFSPNHLLKWALITEFAKKGYYYVNLNGVSSDFAKENEYNGLNKFKLGFTNHAVELIGEFDLPINLSMYHFFNNSRVISKHLSKITKRD